ncbi:MAG TPA: hypothetical protein VFI23_15665 [Rhizomicrobium sp.]|nr:hypothetical protein [Rhizomicrobium sp.]
MIRVFLGVIAACFLSLSAYADSDASSAAPAAGAAEGAHPPRRAQFLKQAASPAVRQMADWVADSRDNDSLPFVIIDKPNAKVFVFDKDARLLGAAWALVGLERGDDSIPGIGTMPLKAITPQMRTTPAGRFVAALGNDLGSLNVLWVDYATAISLHRVINTNPAERRLERIVSPAPAEHRISYGCINVPAKFFDSVVDPAFSGTKGVVYILPEVKTMGAVFPAFYEVDGGSGLLTASKASNPATVAAYRENSGSVEDHDLLGIVHGPGPKTAEKTLAQ